jgi:hypothetical protein
MSSVNRLSNSSATMSSTICCDGSPAVSTGRVATRARSIDAERLRVPDASCCLRVASSFSASPPRPSPASARWMRALRSRSAGAAERSAGDHCASTAGRSCAVAGSRAGASASATAR